MNDLRHWSDEGATSEELELLDAARSRVPTSGARARTLTALGLGSTVVATTATATATTGTGLMLKGTAIAILIGGLATGGLWLNARREASLASGASLPSAAPVANRGEAVPPVMSAAAEAPEPPPSEPEPEAAPSATVARAEPPRPASSARGPAPAASLSRELAALVKAHRALEAKDGDAALRELDRYHAQFPQGALASEETVLRVKALLARGDIARATAMANALSAAYPESPYARRVQDLIAAHKKK